MRHHLLPRIGSLQNLRTFYFWYCHYYHDNYYCYLRGMSWNRTVQKCSGFGICKQSCLKANFFLVYVRFVEVFTAVTKKNVVLWDVAPCSSCVNRRFRRTCRLHLHALYASIYLLTLLPRSRVFLPWRWKRYVPPKRRFTQELHGATSQKTASFVVTAATTSNLT
jgi:hypothetical protein